jgi:hypothetical protein
MYFNNSLQRSLWTEQKTPMKLIQLLSIGGAQVVQNVTLLTMVDIAIGNFVFIITRA